MFFQILGEITNVHAIAAGRRIRQLARLRKSYGPGRWRKMKGDVQWFGWPTVSSDGLSYTGTRHMAWAGAA